MFLVIKSLKTTLKTSLKKKQGIYCFHAITECRKGNRRPARCKSYIQTQTHFLDIDLQEQSFLPPIWKSDNISSKGLSLALFIGVDLYSPEWIHTSEKMHFCVFSISLAVTEMLRGAQSGRCLLWTIRALFGPSGAVGFQVSAGWADRLIWICKGSWMNPLPPLSSPSTRLCLLFTVLI